jgi:hypothetical protein
LGYKQVFASKSEGWRSAILALNPPANYARGFAIKQTPAAIPGFLFGVPMDGGRSRGGSDCGLSLGRQRWHGYEPIREKYCGRNIWCRWRCRHGRWRSCWMFRANRLTEIMRGTRDVYRDPARTLLRHRSAFLVESAGRARSLQGGAGPQLQEDRAAQGGLINFAGGAKRRRSGIALNEPSSRYVRNEWRHCGLWKRKSSLRAR